MTGSACAHRPLSQGFRGDPRTSGEGSRYSSSFLWTADRQVLSAFHFMDRLIFFSFFYFRDPHNRFQLILCCFFNRKKSNNAQFCKSKPSLLQSRVWVFLQQNILPKSIYGKLILLRNPTVFNFARFVQLKFHARFIIKRHWLISRLKQHQFWKDIEEKLHWVLFSEYYGRISFVFYWGLWRKTEEISGCRNRWFDCRCSHFVSLNAVASSTILKYEIFRSHFFVVRISHRSQVFAHPFSRRAAWLCQWLAG